MRDSDYPFNLSPKVQIKAKKYFESENFKNIFKSAF